jgi:predicted extracellular nuclease
MSISNGSPQRELAINPLSGKLGADHDVVVVGDLNDYQFSPALKVLTTGTSDGTGKPTLTDLITTLPANQQYTYDFQGQSEVLDHILLTKSIKKFTYQVVHINAEFANQTSDHDPQVVDIKP